MIGRKSRLVIAAGFCVIWLGILYAGADHPPPVGFFWLVLLCLIAAVLVFIRVPAYASWSEARSRFRLLRVVLDGVVAGLVFALIPLVINGGGEPSIDPSWGDRMIWFAVLAGVGVTNAMIVYFFSFVSNRLAQDAQ